MSANSRYRPIVVRSWNHEENLSIFLPKYRKGRHIDERYIRKVVFGNGDPQLVKEKFWKILSALRIFRHMKSLILPVDIHNSELADFIEDPTTYDYILVLNEVFGNSLKAILSKCNKLESINLSVVSASELEKMNGRVFGHMLKRLPQLKNLCIFADYS